MFESHVGAFVYFVNFFLSFWLFVNFVWHLFQKFCHLLWNALSTFFEMLYPPCLLWNVLSNVFYIIHFPERKGFPSLKPQPRVFFQIDSLARISVFLLPLISFCFIFSNCMFDHIMYQSANFTLWMMIDALLYFTWSIASCNSCVYFCFFSIKVT